MIAAASSSLKVAKNASSVTPFSRNVVTIDGY